MLGFVMVPCQKTVIPQTAGRTTGRCSGEAAIGSRRMELSTRAAHRNYTKQPVTDARTLDDSELK